MEDRSSADIHKIKGWGRPAGMPFCISASSRKQYKSIQDSGLYFRPNMAETRDKYLKFVNPTN